ncbi:CpaF family protein, partial [Candidatus Micrarchaeota archaeon]|nr:CpaF family protein [Candidatus Micrarchaeota archaeon]
SQKPETKETPSAPDLNKALFEQDAKEEKLAQKLEELQLPGQTEKEKLHWVLESKREEAARKETKKFRKRKLVVSYGDTNIYEVEGSELLHYDIPVPKPTSTEKAMINAIKEAATRLISIAPYKIRDPEQKRNVYYQKIMDILRNNPELNIPTNRYDFYAKAVVREMAGYGIIDPLIRDDLLEEIMVTGAHRPVYVFHREYEMMTTNIEFYNENEIQDLVNRIAREVGRRVDISSPLLDARLPDGSRVNATIPPASVDQSSLTIRKFRKDPYSLVDLIQLKTLNVETAAFLWLCVEGIQVKPANILISGGTGSGKTTTLNALAAMIPERERIVTIEDTAELFLPLDHWIRLEARPPGLEGTGELTMDILTKNALRMRPDRILVGEVRHAEAFTLFTALNTGHDGCCGTVHANSPEETIIRVTSPPMNVPIAMLAALDLIIVENRLHDKRKGTIRRVTEIAQLSGVYEGKPTTQNIFEWNAITDELERTAIGIDYIKKLQKLTGLGRKQIELEWKKRERFLSGLVQKNIRGIRKTREETNRFLQNK